MFFGLKGTPSCFQRVMNTVLLGLQGIQCFVYLDDVVIYASTLSEHNSKLKSAFDCLRNNNLSLPLNKCEFLRKEVTYLGHVINESGIHPYPEKPELLKTILSLRIPNRLSNFWDSLNIIVVLYKTLPI